MFEFMHEYVDIYIYIYISECKYSTAPIRLT